MDTGTFRGIITGVLIIAFIGLTLWAYSKRRKPDFDEAANLPFADEQEPAPRDPPTSPQERVETADSRRVASRKDKGDKQA